MLQEDFYGRNLQEYEYIFDYYHAYVVSTRLLASSSNILQHVTQFDAIYQSTRRPIPEGTFPMSIELLSTITVLPTLVSLYEGVLIEISPMKFKNWPSLQNDSNMIIQ